MFQQLMPLLTSKQILMTISPVGNNANGVPLLQVVIEPRRLNQAGEKLSAPAANAAKSLTIPFAVTGTAAELDSPEFVEKLTAFQGIHTQTEFTLNEIQKEADELVKKAKEDLAAKAKANKSTAFATKPSSTVKDINPVADSTPPTSLPGANTAQTRPEAPAALDPSRQPLSLFQF